MSELGWRDLGVFVACYMGATVFVNLSVCPPIYPGTLIWFALSIRRFCVAVAVAERCHSGHSGEADLVVHCGRHAVTGGCWIACFPRRE